MDKYIGNKKSILESIEQFLTSKGINSGLIIDAFSGTTNVGQYFKQRGFSIVSNDVNELSYIMGKVYIENNTFPEFREVLTEIQENYEIDQEQINRSLELTRIKIQNEKIFEDDYFERINYAERIIPMLEVIQYLNNLSLENLSEEELLFWNYYTIYGNNSLFRSSRGTEGKRNYFTSDNAKRLGKLLVTIKNWYFAHKISEMEFNILLCSIIEEVTLNANVNGTFHDFNRSKLYPNAQADLLIKPVILNICENPSAVYYVSREDSNKLFEDAKFNDILKAFEQSVLYIDPPYNFRQYSAYYHMLNFIAGYHKIAAPLEYAKGFKFVRGQNMIDNFNSQYCYKEKFIPALEDLITNVKSKSVVISYYDENNHWNHGKEVVSLEGREEILRMFDRIEEISEFDKTPYTVTRANYQSRSGAHKKEIDELLFYARR